MAIVFPLTPSLYETVDLGILALLIGGEAMQKKENRLEMP